MMGLSNLQWKQCSFYFVAQVDMEVARTLPGWVPRRLGGGFSGKKESGQLRFGGIDRPFRRPIIVKRESGMRGGRDIVRLTESDDRERYGM